MSKDFEQMAAEIGDPVPEVTVEESKLSEMEKRAKIQLPISEKDKDNFEVALLDDCPYTERLIVIKDKLAVTFCTRSVQQNESIWNRLSQIKGDNSSLVEFETLQIKLFLAASLRRIDQGDKFKDFALVPEDERLKYLTQMPAPKYIMLLNAMQLFDKKVDQMRELSESLFF